MKVGILWTILARNLASGGGKSRNDNVKEGNPQLAEDIAAFKHIQRDCFPFAKANAKHWLAQGRLRPTPWALLANLTKKAADAGPPLPLDQASAQNELGSGCGATAFRRRDDIVFVIAVAIQAVAVNGDLIVRIGFAAGGMADGDLAAGYRNG